MYRSLHQHRVRLLKLEKYHILTAKWYHPEKPFDEKLYICETCHEHLYKNEIPCQEVCNNLALDPILDELEKVLISKRIFFKKRATIYGKGKFSKIKGIICNIAIEMYAANKSSDLPRLTVFNGLIVVKSKQGLEYRGSCVF